MMMMKNNNNNILMINKSLHFKYTSLTLKSQGNGKRFIKAWKSGIHEDKG
jgi:hypothetical protein